MIYLDWMQFGFQCLDGPEWTTAALAASTTYRNRSVAVGNGVAVAVSGAPATPYAVYSTDAGDTWNVATINGFTGSPGEAFSPVYGNGWFFATVNAIQGMRSNDGQTWDAVGFTSVPSYDIAGYAIGKFFVVGSSDSFGIRYSSDNAATWSSASSLPSYFGASGKMADDGTTAMVPGWSAGTGFVITTSDGNTWTKKSAPWTVAAPNSIACNGSRFVTVGEGTSGSNASWYSDDAGDTWTSATIAGLASNVWQDVIHNGGIFIAVCDTTTEVAISEDGANWTLSPNPMVTGGATSIAADGNNYIAQDTATLNTIRIGRCVG